MWRITWLGWMHVLALFSMKTFELAFNLLLQGKQETSTVIIIWQQLFPASPVKLKAGKKIWSHIIELTCPWHQSGLCFVFCLIPLHPLNGCLIWKVNSAHFEYYINCTFELAFSRNLIIKPYHPYQEWLCRLHHLWEVILQGSVQCHAWFWKQTKLKL